MDRLAYLASSYQTLFTIFPDVPEGYCRCGCGGRTELASATRRERGEYRGESKPFLYRHSRVHPFDSFFTRTEGCWICKGHVAKNGYGIYVPTPNGLKVYAHRFAFEREYGPLPQDKPYILHRCDNPPCVRPHDLFAGTAGDNMRDCAAKGRNAWQNPAKHVRGDTHPNAVLTRVTATVIRKEYIPGTTTQISLARKCGVSQGTVSNVLLGYTWNE